MQYGHHIDDHPGPGQRATTGTMRLSELWTRAGLSPRDRSLVTVAALVALRRPEELPPYLDLALQHGVSKSELTELITHLAMFADWPSAAAALAAARRVLDTSD